MKRLILTSLLAAFCAQAQIIYHLQGNMSEQTYDADRVAIWPRIYSDLPESRYLDFNDYALTNNTPMPTWVHGAESPFPLVGKMKALLPGTNHFHRTGWTLRSCRTGCSGYLSNARIVPPLNPASAPTYPAIATNLAANLRNDSGAYIESPVFTNGVGTVYFDAINGIVNPIEITVEAATNSVMGTNDWKQLDVVTLDAASTNEFYRYSRLLNYRQWMKIRIRRTGALYGTEPDANYTVIDNIRVSTPPTQTDRYQSPDFTGLGHVYPAETP